MAYSKERYNLHVRTSSAERRLTRQPAYVLTSAELTDRLNEAVRDRQAAEREAELYRIQRDQALALMADVMAALDQANRKTYQLLQMVGAPESLLRRMDLAPTPMMR